MKKMSGVCALVMLWIFLTLICSQQMGYAADREILNVSYDPTRELYRDVNEVFIAYWKSVHNENIQVRQSHGGAGKQARAVIDGLEADVVTLALAYDIDAIARIAKLMPADWQSRLPNNSCPYTSTIIFLVRKGNPKNIRDWDDLAKPGVQVITPNPKTSGGARWNFLAAWGYALDKWGKDEQKAQEFVGKIFKNVPVLDTGARGSTTTFLRGIGDVFISWENEALLAVNKLGKEQLEIVVPSVSIMAEPPVTVMTQNAEKHGVTDIAQGYLEFLYTEKGQELCAKHYYRPSMPNVLEKYKNQFPRVKTFSIDEYFGGWAAAQKKFFADQGVFDQIYGN
ncbi:sulfate ABC transporter substrate-binding protein [candidate division KSB1 bacterium]|nr:sulfate ABC transporter substrate-binding protein [candidate division KSB1 bacterium]